MNLNLRSRHDDLETTTLYSLEHLNEQIGELENSLEEMRARRKELEQDLALIRASKAPIRRLPTEILVSIFEEILYGRKIQDEEQDEEPEEEPEEDGSNIADLMLVCIAWYRIIIGAPRLWSKIEIRATEKKFGSQWVSRQARYVEAFMEHSGKMPVEVSLDFFRLKSGEEYLKRKIGDAMDDLLREVTPEGEDTIYYEYDGVLDEMWQGTLRVLYEGLCQRLVRSITGKDESYMKRWRSLQLVLPLGVEGLAAVLLKCMDYPAPQLRELDIYAWDLQKSWETHSFRRLPALDRIVITSNFMPTLLPESFGAQRLELFGVRSLNDVDNINSFSNLRYLRLQVIRTTNPGFHRVTLPHLQTLRLGGDISDSMFDAFMTSHLPELIIDCLGEGCTGYVPYPTADQFRNVGIVNIFVPKVVLP